ncbi:9653_t:CDS:1, partial [Racocetra fulgida]
MPKVSKKCLQMIQLTANRVRAKKIRKATDALQCLDEDFDSVL